MFTEFARDHAFTIAWFGLMTMVWFGWGQEDPPQRWRWRLGVGSALGVVLAGLFGYGVFTRWDEGSALEGRYGLFGILVLLEVAVAGAVHFIGLAFLLNDWSLAALGGVQLVALVAVRPRLKSGDWPTSRLVGPVMGTSLLVFALLSAAIFLAGVGLPW